MEFGGPPFSKSSVKMYKNVFVLVLTHLESELELFEVDDICDDGDDDL